MKNYDYIKYNNQVNVKKENGFYDLQSDKLAIESYEAFISDSMLKFDNYMDKIDYLIEEKYYINFFESYPREFIKKISDVIYSKKFKFQSFMAISKFYESYSLRSRDKQFYLETYEDRIIAVALFLARANRDMALDLAISMINQEYQPATPTFLNSGKIDSGELISCFLLEMDDSLNSINYNISTSMQLSKIGGGVAINLSRLRGRGASIKKIKNIGRGIIPVMKLLEDAFSYVDQLGQRPGAGAVYLNVFHWDLIEFLDTKKINSDEKARIQTLSLGLIIPDIFFELAKKDEDLCLFEPHSVYSEIGIDMDDLNMDEYYYILKANPNIRRKVISTRDLLQKIALTQFESGYPYLVYLDNANKTHALNNVGKIKMSNLCTEIFQLQTPSHITDYKESDDIGYDICCNLGSLNLTNLMEHKNLEKTIDIATRSLTSVSELCNIKNAPGVMKANNDFHAIGLGVMNLHGFLAKNKIAYDSPDALDFCNTFFPILNYYSLMASKNIAKEKSSKFRGFSGSTYATGEFFNQYLEKDFVPTSAKVKALFKDIYIPTIYDWQQLKQEIQKHGLYNAYRLAIAPTQSISYIQNATASVQPIVNQVETRMYKDSITYYPMPYLDETNVFYYKSAYNMDQKKIIDLVATIQPHIDQGISTVLYVTNMNTTKDLAHYYYYAWAKGLKSLYYVRTKNLSIEECETCSV